MGAEPRDCKRKNAVVSGQTTNCEVDSERAQDTGHQN